MYYRDLLKYDGQYYYYNDVNLKDDPVLETDLKIIFKKQMSGNCYFKYLKERYEAQWGDGAFDLWCVNNLKNKIQCFNGQFYVGNIAKTDNDIREMILKEIPRISINERERILTSLKIDASVSKRPDYQIPKVTPKDNKFRFPLAAYQLLHYYLFEPRQAYIHFIMGEGGKGKSTFSNFLKHLFKNETYSGDTKFMNQFSTASWAGKRLVIFNDCTTQWIENSHVLKQISGSDDIQIEAKGMQPYTSQMDSHLLFIGNEPIGYNILDSGMRRRFVNIPWVNSNLTTPDPKWVNYKWSDEEIAFQIELAKKIGPLNHSLYIKRTIKEVLINNKHFRYVGDIKSTDLNAIKDRVSNLNDYKGNYYSVPNFIKFIKLVKENFTKKEYLEALNTIPQEGEEDPW